jgi:hypothetical protein
MERPWILLHVGYPRTGTTFLQREVFRPGSTAWFPVNRRRAGEELIKPTGFEFDIERARKFLKEELARRSPDDSRVPVLSHEGLVDVLEHYGARSREIADRLHSIVEGRARVLIVVREQRAQILSHYGHHRRDGGPLSLGKFLRMEDLVSAHTPAFRFSLYEYDRLVRYYQSRFGKANVLVLTAEELRQDGINFLRRLYEFGRPPTEDISSVDLNARPNASLPVVRLKARRFSAKFGRSTFLRQDALSISPLWGIMMRMEKGLAGLVPRTVERRVRERWWRMVDSSVGIQYGQSNQRLAELTGLPLADLGYVCEGSDARRRKPTTTGKISGFIQDASVGVPSGAKFQRPVGFRP